VNVYAHSIAHVVFLLVRFGFGRIETSSDNGFVVDIHFDRCHSNGSVMCVIVRIREFRQRVHVSPGVPVGEIATYFRLQSPVETFHYARLQIFVFTCVELYPVTLQHGLKRPIQELRSFVALHHVTFPVR